MPKKGQRHCNTIPCEILEYLLQTSEAQPCRVKVPPQKSENREL